MDLKPINDIMHIFIYLLNILILNSKIKKKKKKKSTIIKKK